MSAKLVAALPTSRGQIAAAAAAASPPRKRRASAGSRIRGPRRQGCGRSTARRTRRAVGRVCAAGGGCPKLTLRLANPLSKRRTGVGPTLDQLATRQQPPAPRSPTFEQCEVLYMSTLARSRPPGPRPKVGRAAAERPLKTKPPRQTSLEFDPARPAPKFGPAAHFAGGA
eukprot:359192-Chlamydomonas_euryale.AAC.10